MEFLGNAFNVIFYQSLLKALVLLYQYLPGHDFGVAVIVLTVLIKLILYPLGAKGIRSQKALQDIQPKIKEIQGRFKDDKARQAKEVMELYKKEKVNPFSGFLLLLIQVPVFFAFFWLFREGFNGIDGLNTTFLGIVNLAESSAVLVILAGIAQFWQAKMITPSSAKAPAGKPDFSSMMQKQMLYFLPLFTLFILWKMPSALALYWLTTTIFTIIQQYITLKNQKHAAIQSRKN